MLLHAWSDQRCEQILKNCYEALPDNGKVIIAESILPEAPVDTTTLVAKFAVQSDVNMLAFLEGGKERMENEFHNLAKAAGFKGFQKVCYAYTLWFMELTK